MKSIKQAIGFGLLTWIIPFFVGFFFVNQKGEYLIPETFFKTIMIVVGALVGVILAVKYFQSVTTGFQKEGIKLGLIWLFINWTLDLVMVNMGFFKMTIPTYFTDIGLRYLSAPVYTIGMGWILKLKIK